MSLRVAVFASGGGSNLQALLDNFNTHDRVARIVLVVSDREDAPALERARKAGIEAVVIPVTGRPMDYVSRETLVTLESADVDLIALAGYLRLVPPAVVRRYRNRILNIHPALLPAFGGKGMFGVRVHRAVLDAGAKISGATVHLVDEEYDTGAIIAQWPVPVLPGDTPEALAARVLRVEHLLYPAALETVAHRLESGDEPESHAARNGAFTWSAEPAPTASDIRRALNLE